MSASEATKAIMENIMEIADLLTLYTYALVISNTNMDSFKYFGSVLGLQLVFMLNEFMLNGFDWDLKSIARLLVVFKYADYCPKIMEVMQMEEDGETDEFLFNEDIAAAVTQAPMEEGSDDETQCDKDVVPHADGAAALDLALRYLEQ
ncbi:uncharacterized protein TNCV_4022531 [Trichonephila clavipes]|nr:uncharacterized protein TNCV_4022531 [Trichonephila clavipes]